MSKLNIGLILPDVLGTYGDDGNALVLRQRARMRGLEAEIVPIRLGEAIPEHLDVYTLGGGEDTAQILAAEHIRADGGLNRAVANGRPVLAICAGFQVLGESFRAAGRIVMGAGLVDATTGSLVTRAIGEVLTTPTKAAWTDQLTQPLTGFENHMGATLLGSDASPLAMTARGRGNTDAAEQEHFEGAVQGSVICTYMHGPVLARNPELADVLLAQAMGKKLADLEPLDLEVVEKLRQERMT